MATCRIKQKADSSYVVKAPNGAPSLLYQELLEKTRDQELAKDLYVLAETPKFIQTVTQPIVNSEGAKTTVDFNGTKVYLKQHTNPITNRPTGMMEIDLIVTPIDQRRQGNAKVALRRALEYTDNLGMDVILTVAPRDGETSEEGLKKFYRVFGFTEYEFDFQMKRRKRNPKQAQRQEENPFFDSNGEIKAKYVLRYVQQQNIATEPLTFEQQLEVQDIMAIGGIQNSQELYDILKQAFYKDGMFEPSVESIMDTGIYSAYEARKITEDPTLLENIKEAIERLKNTPTVENGVQGAPQEYLKKTTTFNNFGKLNTNNPLKEENEMVQQYGGIGSEGLSEDLLDYKRLPVLKDDLSPEMTTVVKPSATQVAEDIQLIADIEFIQAMSEPVQQTQEARDFMVVMEKNAAKLGIDIIGVGNFANYTQILEPLRRLLINPSVENTQGFEQAYSDIFDAPQIQKERVIKGLGDKTLVYSETQMSEQELYQNGYVRTDTLNILHRVEQLPTEELMEIANTTEAMEDYQLQKIAWGYNMEVPQAEKPQDFSSKMNSFTGNAEYLKNDFPSVFWANYLLEKQKQSKAFTDFYSNFDINEKGIYLLNSDAITVQKIKMYLEQGKVKNSEDIQQYSMLSKQLPLLAQEMQIPVLSKEQRRAAAVNGQSAVDKPKNSYNMLSQTVIAMKQGTQEFIKIPQGIFELQETQSDTSYYSKLQPELETGYYNLEPLPPAYIEVSDFANKVNTKTTPYKTMSNLYTKKESEKIVSENFDCI